jgi:hypothetical protein
LEEKVDEEKTKRLAAEKKVEKFKEKVDHMASEMQHLQDQVSLFSLSFEARGIFSSIEAGLLR